MKKKIAFFILTGMIALSLCGCENKETENIANPETENTKEEAVSGKEEEIQNEENLESQTEAGEETFSFADFKNLTFWFSSGAGGWATSMAIAEDGSFFGEYFDGDLGCTGDGYPNGTMYQCDFSGQFTQPVKVNDYTYSMQIAKINYKEEAGKEEIIDGILYCYTEPYGLNEAEDILIYLPGAPLSELSEEFRSWVGYYDLSETEDTALPFYALYNEAPQYGFSSYNIIENIKETIANTEQWAAVLEASIKNDTLTQTEYNEKTQELYEMWDLVLNQLWNVLKETLDEDTMSTLTLEEREWIALKEQESDKAGKEYEGGSMEAMARNQKAAEMTKERVYELEKLLD